MKKGFLSINQKLLVTVLLASTLFTTFTTMVNFYIDYSSEKEVQAQTLTQIEKSTLGSLTKAVWDLDEDQLDRNMSGLLQLHDVISVAVYDPSGEPIRELKKTARAEKELKYSFSKHYPLHYVQGKKMESIGEFRISITNYFLYLRLLKKMIVFFLSQGAKTILVSALLLLIFRKLVTQYLDQIAKHCTEQAGSDISKLKKLGIRRSDVKHEDEFDVLIGAFNRLVGMISQAEKKRNEEMLQKEQALNQLARLASLGEMAGNIGHEINNPLTIMHGVVHGVKRRISDLNAPDQEPFQKLIPKMEDSMNRIRKISKSLSVLVRESNGDSYKDTSLEVIVDEIQSLVSEKMRSKGIRFETKIDDPRFLIRVDRIQIGQVLINLLNNAIHVVEELENPWISLLVETDAHSTRIRVVDSGPGVPEEHRDTIFVPFFTTKEVGKGTGLGLSISSKIVKQHRGTLSLEQAKHTTFCIELPRADAFESKEAA